MEMNNEGYTVLGQTKMTLRNLREMETVVEWQLTKFQIRLCDSFLDFRKLFFTNWVKNWESFSLEDAH